MRQLKLNASVGLGLLVVSTFALSTLSTGCSKGSPLSTSSSGGDTSGGGTGGGPSPSPSPSGAANCTSGSTLFSTSVLNGSQTLYSDSNTSNQSALILTAGATYTVNIASSNSTLPLTFSYKNIVSQNSTSATSLVVGSQTFSAPSTVGPYNLTITSAPGCGSAITKTYQVIVMCANPTLQKSAFANTVISVSPSPGPVSATQNNSFVLTATNLPTGSYTCAWDVNGDGTNDTGYTDCSNGTSAVTAYVDYVGPRNVSLTVYDDACWSSIVVTNSPTSSTNPQPIPSFAYVVPPFGQGINFVKATVSPTPGSPQIMVSSVNSTTVPDPRIYGVNFLATDVTTISGSPYSAMISNTFSPSNNFLAGYNVNSFTIAANRLQGSQPGSVPFGMTVTVSNLSSAGNILVAAPNSACKTTLSTPTCAPSPAFSPVPSSSSNPNPSPSPYLSPVPATTPSPVPSASASPTFSITYTTDANADASAQVSLSSTNCQGTAMIFPRFSASPCSSGTGDTNQLQLEIYGTFSCPGVYIDSTHQVDIVGSYDALNVNQDSCFGGQNGSPGLPPLGSF